uniref:Archease domain-containing protein n=1 Tax=uncultured marine group II/III euryarchaeote KM3_18_D06 TaxID=1457956 RepID=A0A075GQF3_9EURY|nr:hypothetical protein [uncultured marine group II/III euryarchaeote KM3_18_D06]
MSWWILPTTADIGLRAFGANPEFVIKETTLGMQSILLSEAGAKALPQLVRKTGQWSVERQDELDRTLVKWLEEVLYQAEVEGRWLVDSQVQIGQNRLDAQVSFVDADEVEREVEIKAVTRHELLFDAVPAGIEIPGVEPDIPTFVGPGWVTQVIFDI